MSGFLVLAFLFFIGSVTGWVIELLFRRFISKNNPSRKWINPGFCVGPYIPLYGFGLCILYALSMVDEYLPDNFGGVLLMVIMMSVAMTLIEFLAGLLVLKISNVRLWDYSKEWGNVKGLICPKFSLIWAACAAAYYYLLHPIMIDEVIWLSEHLAYSFVIGLFFGFFIIDVIYSGNILVKLRKIAIEKGIIVRFEAVKHNIRQKQDENREKARFVFAFKGVKNLSEHIEAVKSTTIKKNKKK